MITEEDLKEMEARASAATPGRWRDAIFWNDGCYPIGPYTRNEATAKADSAFIAHSRTDLPRCVEEIRRLRAALERVWKQTNDPWINDFAKAALAKGGGT